MTETHHFSNQQVAKLLRSTAAALSLGKANTFQVRAYENAADSIEHLDSEVEDIWQEGKLDSIPGIGKGLQEHLDELFKTGHVRHFDSITKSLPPVFFDLLGFPGIGPKTALEITKYNVKDLDELKKKIKNGELVKKGFSAKLAEKIMSGAEELSSRGDRMLLPYASAQAQKIVDYLKKGSGIMAVNSLGSLRRQVATVGDLDFSASASNPKTVIEYFTKMPGVTRVLDKGDNKGSVVLGSSLQVDLLVGLPESYGALLQHFTGGKNHNIKLRTYALQKGLSLSEEGVKRVKSLVAEGEPRQGRESRVEKETIIHTKTEEEFYRLLNMQTPPPEIREDTGEIEAAIAHKLPKLVEFGEIKGDLHLHSNFPIEHPSRGPGADSIEIMIKKAVELKYDYVGISDHPPGFRTASQAEMRKSIEKRTKFVQSIKKSTKSIRVLNGLEIDILGDGSLSVPDELLKTLDYVIAGIHSGHRGTKEIITKRLLKALENPYVKILSHPTNRLLNERESSEADWEEIFKFCAKNGKLLEINAYPNRLDLRDDLVRMALGFGCKFIINTDSHEVSQMENMRFGVAVARRGWAEAKDVVNTWEWTKFAEWFKIKT